MCEETHIRLDSVSEAIASTTDDVIGVKAIDSQVLVFCLFKFFSYIFAVMIGVFLGKKNPTCRKPCL